MKRPDMPVQEELQGMPGIEADDRIARPGQDVDEPVDRRCLELPFRPVDLGFLPGQKRELEKRLLPLLPQLQGRPLDRPVTARVAEAAEPVESLDGHERGRLLVPLGQKPLVGRDDRRLRELPGRRPTQDPRDGFSAQPHLRGDLAHGQAFDLPEPANLDPKRLVHYPQDKSPPAPWLSRLVSRPGSSGGKYSIINAPEEDLVLYHPRGQPARDEEEQLVHGLLRGSLVLHHRPGRPSRPPLFDVGVTTAEVAGITFGPAVLGQDLARLPARVPSTGLLPRANAGIRPIIPAAELTSLDHPGPPG